MCLLNYCLLIILSIIAGGDSDLLPEDAGEIVGTLEATFQEDSGDGEVTFAEQMAGVLQSSLTDEEGGVHACLGIYFAIEMSWTQTKERSKRGGREVALVDALVDDLGKLVEEVVAVCVHFCAVWKRNQ